MNVRAEATSDPIAHPMVVKIRYAIVDATGASLSGLYLYGSLATRDFEPDVSDIDLIGVLTVAPDEQLASRLRETHARLAERARSGTTGSKSTTSQHEDWPTA
jgi:hypothetical protein